MMPNYFNINIENTPKSSNTHKHSFLNSLKLMQYAASIMQKSSQLIKHQQRLLFECLKLINKQFKNLKERAHETKIYRIIRVYSFLQAIYNMIDFKTCLLYALFLKIIKINCMTDVEATDFPSVLQL